MATENETTPITAEEFDLVYPWERRTTKATPEGRALRALGVGKGFKAACRWKHYGSSCGGGRVMNHTAKRANIVVRTRCRNRVLYVLRDA